MTSLVAGIHEHEGIEEIGEARRQQSISQDENLEIAT